MLYLPDVFDLIKNFLFYEKLLYMFRIGDILFNENLGLKSALKMKIILNSLSKNLLLAIKITYSRGGAICKIKHFLANFIDLLFQFRNTLSPSFPYSTFFHPKLHNPFNKSQPLCIFLKETKL